MKPGFLKNREVIEWLDGVEPIWACLEFESFCRLQLAPDEPDSAISLAHDLSPADLANVPIAGNLMLLLQAAAAPGGLKLTARGNLSLAAVERLARACHWPGAGLEIVFRHTRRLNEAAVWPLHFLRLLATDLRLLRKQGGALVLTARGRAALASRGAGDLLARMFEDAFWRFNLACFDGYPLQEWPQSEMALTLWCLAVGANIWERPARLARLATTPTLGILQAETDFAGDALETRVLRFLTFFGLLESQVEDPAPASWLEQRRYRRTPFCDRFLAFDVEVETPQGPMH